MTETAVPDGLVPLQRDGRRNDVHRNAIVVAQNDRLVCDQPLDAVNGRAPPEGSGITTCGLQPLKVELTLKI